MGCVGSFEIDPVLQMQKWTKASQAAVLTASWFLEKLGAASSPVQRLMKTARIRMD